MWAPIKEGIWHVFSLFYCTKVTDWVPPTSETLPEEQIKIWKEYSLVKSVTVFNLSFSVLLAIFHCIAKHSFHKTCFPEQHPSLVKTLNPATRGAQGFMFLKKSWVKVWISNLGNRLGVSFWLHPPAAPEAVHVRTHSFAQIYIWKIICWLIILRI